MVVCTAATAGLHKQVVFGAPKHYWRWWWWRRKRPLQLIGAQHAIISELMRHKHLPLSGSNRPELNRRNRWQWHLSGRECSARYVQQPSQRFLPTPNNSASNEPLKESVEHWMDHWHCLTTDVEWVEVSKCVCVQWGKCQNCLSCTSTRQHKHTHTLQWEDRRVLRVLRAAVVKTNGKWGKYYHSNLNRGRYNCVRECCLLKCLSIDVAAVLVAVREVYRKQCYCGASFLKVLGTQALKE